MKKRYPPWYVYFIFLTILYSCEKEYSYEGSRISSGYLVKDAFNNCSLATVSGNFRVFKNISDSNFLTVQVHVSRPGNYTVQSGLVNGYSFTASGLFSDTGTVLLRLPAQGKPIIAGTDVFNIFYDSTTCQALVTVVDTISNIVITTNPDHFPLTDKSYWCYDDLSYPGDSIVRKLTGQTIQNNIPHQDIDEYISFFPAANTQYYRKSGSDYFRYSSVSMFTSALNYSPSIFDDLNFLKEDITTGQSWFSDTYSGRTSLDAKVVSLRYNFRCVDADAVVLINGKTFIKVYKIQMIPEIAPAGFSFTPTGEIHTMYYAKGVGLIYAEFYNGILSHPVLQLRKWLVN